MHYLVSKTYYLWDIQVFQWFSFNWFSMSHCIPDNSWLSGVYKLPTFLLSLKGINYVMNIPCWGAMNVILCWYQKFCVCNDTKGFFVQFNEFNKERNIGIYKFHLLNSAHIDVQDLNFLIISFEKTVLFVWRLYVLTRTLILLIPYSDFIDFLHFEMRGCDDLFICVCLYPQSTSVDT